MRDYVRDLVGDARKRVAMGTFARESVRHRTWEAIGDELLEHYRLVRTGAGLIAN
jgi:phosphatidylinositol alpha 1,6-mannosyltransferase